jgi:hypothetical protein
VVEVGGDAQGFKFHQQSVGHWLVQDQLRVAQVGLTYEVKNKELRKQLEDLEHYIYETRTPAFQGVSL